MFYENALLAIGLYPEFLSGIYLIAYLNFIDMLTTNAVALRTSALRRGPRIGFCLIKILGVMGQTAPQEIAREILKSLRAARPVRPWRVDLLQRRPPRPTRDRVICSAFDEPSFSIDLLRGGFYLLLSCVVSESNTYHSRECRFGFRKRAGDGQTKSRCP